MQRNADRVFQRIKMKLGCISERKTGKIKKTQKKQKKLKKVEKKY